MTTKTEKMELLKELRLQNKVIPLKLGINKKVKKLQVMNKGN